MTESNVVHLTTSRVNRLLRPLRNKCNGLAALSKTANASRITYSTQSNWDPDSHPPLSLLCPSARTKKSVFKSHSTDEFELSKRIYAVCDTFKNIAHVGYGQPCTERIPSLAAMCTLIIGENIPGAIPDSALDDSSEDSTDENYMPDIDSIYEAVPSHYRRFLIVSHALFMILRTCAHHHSLMTILLGHCLSFDLIHESTHLLNIILAQAFMSHKSSHPPPVVHPAHTDYLLDLHAKWTNGNKPSSGSLLFTTSTFCHAVLNALCQTSSLSSCVLWTSKALNRLLHTVERCDVDAYIDIIRALSKSLWDASDSSTDGIRDDAQLATLRDKLSELMSSLFDLLFAQDDLYSSLLTPSRICATMDILHDCHATRHHRLRMSTTGSPIDLPDMITILTTHVFAVFRNSIDNSDLLLAILDDSSPIPTTFSKLIMYVSRFQEGQHFADFVEAFLANLNIYSSAFRSEKLFGLDASLWACALHHFETCIANSQKGTSTLITKYKWQLMEAVDAAERRCFGGEMNSSPVVPPSVRLKPLKRTRHGRLSGHWEWEAMVGSWIRKTPVHKKRKADDSRPYSLSRHNHSYPRSTATSKTVTRPISVSTPLFLHYRHSSTFASSSPCPQLSDSETRMEDGSEYQEGSDKENSPVVKESHLTKRQRRSTSFFSILADAQTNRIVLHPKRRLKSQSPSSPIPEKYLLPLSSQESQRASRKQEQKAVCRKMSPPAALGTSLFSDDSLNLFACATSSPARC